MSSQQYIQNALRTESAGLHEIGKRMSDPSMIRLNHAAIGLVTEAGEFIDALKKHFFYNKPIDKTNLVEELGDVFWYLAIACDELDVTFEQVMAINIKKLQKRFPEKFTEEKAIDRDLIAERQVLESHG